MRTRLTLTLLSSIILSASALQPGAAQEAELDCKNPVSQIDMTECAGRDFDAADAELNKAYVKAREVLREADKQFSKEMQGGEKSLLAGQRGWIAYRDGQCEAAAFGMHGGTAEPMVMLSCKALLTRARTKELLELADGLL